VTLSNGQITATGLTLNLGFSRHVTTVTNTFTLGGPSVDGYHYTMDITSGGGYTITLPPTSPGLSYQYYFSNTGTSGTLTITPNTGQRVLCNGQICNISLGPSTGAMVTSDGNSNWMRNLSN